MKMHLFKVAGEEIISVNYQEYINSFKKDTLGIQKWSEIKKQLETHPLSCGEARYLKFIDNKYVYFFGSGLTKDIIYALMGITKKQTIETKKLHEIINTEYKVEEETFNEELNKWVKEKYPVDFILKGKIGDYIIKYLNNKREFITLDGDKIKITSDRLRLFKQKGHKCCKCGLQGEFFLKCRTAIDSCYHLELYGYNKEGKLVELTKDHILPKSKGGADHISNLQPMCANCNHTKGSNLNLKDKFNGMSKEDVCIAKLSVISKICEKNYKNSKITREELCEEIFNVIKGKDCKSLDNNKSLLKKMGKVIGII